MSENPFPSSLCKTLCDIYLPQERKQRGLTIVTMLSLLALAALVALPTQALIRFPCGQLVTERFDPYAVCISSVVT